MDAHEIDGLLRRADEAASRAMAPYSGLKVGAALMASDGAVYTGCNIENPSLMLTICAERVALYKALSEGANAFRAIAIVCSVDRECTPCGPCRQLLAEFAPEAAVYLRSSAGIRKYTVAEFLPHPFIWP